MNNTILLTKKDQIATITFNRPQAMNALDDHMADKLLAVTTDVAEDDQIRAVCLRGAGNTFMAGGDVKYFYDNLDNLKNNIHGMISKVHAVVNLIQNMPKPILAAVEGSVAGVGFSFMAACDLVLAAEGTKFTLAYTKIGTSPDGGSTYNLPRQIGTKKTMELALFSNILSAEEAKQLGLLNWVVPQTMFEAEINNITKRLALGPTAAYGRVKALINHTFVHDLEEQLLAEEQAFVASSGTADFRQGVTAFVSKSKPIFEGK